MKKCDNCVYTEVGRGVNWAQYSIELCAGCKAAQKQKEFEAAQIRKHRLANLEHLFCDQCGKYFGWVNPGDLNGSMFVCNSCKETI